MDDRHGGACDSRRRGGGNVARPIVEPTGTVPLNHYRLSTLCLSSTPGLKWGVRFSGMETGAPVLGFRPALGARRFREKLPKPRTSTRSPRASVPAMAARIVVTEASTSFAVRRCHWDAIRVTRSGRFKGRRMGGIGYVVRRCSAWRCPNYLKSRACCQLAIRLGQFIPSVPVTAPCRDSGGIPRREIGVA